MMTYDRYDILFQEIPDEISLAFAIEGCPNNCVGCHSPHLREQNGTPLKEDALLSILKAYENNITCVLFLGGDAFHDEVYALSKLIRSKGIKVAFYSGFDEINPKLIPVLDYYKYGSYKADLGGLDSPKTNQRLLKIVDLTKQLTKK